MKIDLHQAIEFIKQGRVIGVPTETVYGLAARLNDPEGIEQIFKLKGRPRNNPLIIHVPSSEKIYPFAKDMPEDFDKLAKAFWPGPITLVIPIKENLIPAVARANLSTAGFRVPKHHLAAELLKAVGPLVMPSANLSGRPSATGPEHVEMDFGVDFPVLDGGPCIKGLESTILCFDNGRWVIVRLGSLTAEEIKFVIGYTPEVRLAEKGSNPLCPGQMFKHYSPKAKLRFKGREDIPFVLGFRERTYEKKSVIFLGSLEHPLEVARDLYKVLRQLDEKEIDEVWVDMDFPADGLWQTIRERLEKASGA